MIEVPDFRYSDWKQYRSPDWGVWDNHRQRWAEQPSCGRWTAEDFAHCMNKAYAEGLADAEKAKAE